MTQPPSESAIPVTPTEEVVNWLLDGHRSSDIRQAIQAKWPNEDAEKLELAAVEHFGRAAHCDVDVIVGWGMEALRDLYRRMLAIGDFAGAAKAVKDLVSLARSYVPSEDDDNEEGDESDTGAKPKG